ncbi:MAG: polysaccharide deacetylase family protein [Eubacteriales bacterium]|nr:polysaccharide deacetylase family protein [Eubacteriales bacterium]
MKRIFSALLFAAMLFTFCFSVSAAYTDERNITGIAPESTVSELKALLSSVLSVTDGETTLSDTDYVGTGNIINCKDGTYKAVVLGDVDGDGKITSRDYLKLKRNFLNLYELKNEYLSAGDADEDGAIKAFDYLIIKRHFLGTYTIGSMENSEKIPVLLYHHILPDEDKERKNWMGNEITISTTEFRRHMQLIKTEGFTVVTIEELIGYIKGERTLPLKSVVLCFDDGYKSNTEYAAPILREFGYQATVFSIISSYFNEYEPDYYTNTLQHITANDLTPYADVLNQQCHTFSNHNQLSMQSYNYIYNDLMLSQNAYPSDYFAYPYGDYDDEAIRAVRDAGFKAAFSTEETYVVVGTELFEIPRFTITTPMSDTELQDILN